MKRSLAARAAADWLTERLCEDIVQWVLRDEASLRTFAAETLGLDKLEDEDIINMADAQGWDEDCK